jgi:hypothetical protein
VIMKADDLIAYLARIGVPNHAFSIYEDRDEAYCVERVGGEWMIYYSERGVKNQLGWAKSEDQAMDILKLFVLEGYGKWVPRGQS